MKRHHGLASRQWRGGPQGSAAPRPLLDAMASADGPASAERPLQWPSTWASSTTPTRAKPVGKLVVIDWMRDETFNSVRAKRAGRQSLSRLRSSTRQESGLLAG